MKTVYSRKYIVDRKRIWVFVFVFSLFTAYCLLPTTLVLAQTDYTLLTPIGNYVGETTQANSYLEGIFKLAIAVAGGLAVIMIIWGGIQYMSTDAISGKSEARNTIQQAIWGLLLAISAWLILNTINPDLVKFNLNIEPIKPSTTSNTSSTTP